VEINIKISKHLEHHLPKLMHNMNVMISGIQRNGKYRRRNKCLKGNKSKGSLFIIAEPQHRRIKLALGGTSF
jgi:hypothetical protein